MILINVTCMSGECRCTSVPDDGHDCDNDGENGPSEPILRESEENPDVPEYGFFCFFIPLFAPPVDEGEWELGSLCDVRTYLGLERCVVHVAHVFEPHDIYNSD